MSAPGQIITFYSYKGGVGRSMAVANTATLLAQKKHRVLVIDFDLEAPGLHRYFQPGRAEPVAKPGTIELFVELRDHLRRRFPDLKALEAPAAEAEAQAAAEAMLRELLRTKEYQYEVTLEDPNASQAKRTVSFMAAGRFSPDFPSRVRGFDWRGLYDDYPFAFAAFSRVVCAEFAYVLIDSRTGISDAGSVCTGLLPDKLVLVFAPNEQSLHGALQIGKQAVQYRALLHPEKFMPLLPLPSRIENAELGQTQRWITDTRRRFRALFTELYGTDSALEAKDSAGAGDYFDRVRIPHTPYYAFGEKIAAEESKEAESQSLSEAFGRFVSYLQKDGAPAEHSGPHASPVALMADPIREGLLLISINGDSLRPAVDKIRAELGLIDVPDTGIVDFSSPSFVEPSVAAWTLLAKQVRDSVRPLVEDPQYERLHLFYKGPVVLAPLIGAMVVPSKPLKIYYFENGKYQLAYTCDRRLVRAR